MASRLKSIGKFLVNTQYAVSVVLTIVLTFLIVYQVFLRYVLKAPLMGIEELMVFPMIWLYFLGGANASYERTHIECGILTLYIKKERSILIFNAAKAIVSFLIALWMCYWGKWYFNYSLSRWKLSNLLYIPMFIAESSYFIGILLMVIYAGRDCCQEIRKAVNFFKKPDEKEENL